MASAVLRFEAISAVVVGILLPLLETCRRGIEHWGANITTMLEDYVAGALLLAGAWAAFRGRSWARVFLVLAWAYVAGTMSGSFWDQLEETIRGTAAESHNSLVLGTKGLLWIVSVISLVMSFRSANAAK